jgi:hypothetical protein
MKVANTLAYYDTATITSTKSFIVQSPEVGIQETTYEILTIRGALLLDWPALSSLAFCN